jgi:hypothetical protein
MAKKGIKVVTIGGGSSYTPELVDGFIKRYKEFPLRELWLVDIEAGREKMEIVGNLAKRMIAAVRKAARPDKEFSMKNIFAVSWFPGWFSRLLPSLRRVKGGLRAPSPPPMISGGEIFAY